MITQQYCELKWTYIRMAIVLIVLGFDSSVPRARNISHTFHLDENKHNLPHPNKTQGRREGGETGATAPGPKCTRGPFFANFIIYFSLKWNRLLRLYLLSEGPKCKADNMILISCDNKPIGLKEIVKYVLSGLNSDYLH